MATSAMEAERLFNEGDVKATGVVQVLTKLKQPHQSILYYAGGVRVLSSSITDDSSRALFRQYGGFNLLTDNAVIKRCIDDVIECDDFMSDVSDLVCVTLDLLAAAVTDNIENTSFLVNLSIAPSLVLGVLSKSSPELQHRCVWLLFTLSQNAEGQDGIVTKFDVVKLLSLLISIVETSPKVASGAAKLLNNLALNHRFNDKFKFDTNRHVVPAFERLLLNYTSLSQSVLVSCISMMSNMAKNIQIRKAMLQNPQFVQAVVQIIEKSSKKLEDAFCKILLHNLIGLLLNISVNSGPKQGNACLPVEGLPLLLILLPLLDRSVAEILRKRALGLISNILPFSAESVAEVAKANYIPKIISVMKGGDQTCGHYGIKCLAVLTQRSDKARKDMVRTDQELKFVRELLKTDSAILIGNAALVISHCTQVAGLSSSLVHSDIVKTLLSHTDSLIESVKQNCAIALAKLATTEERHLDQLRQCGGIGILHSCMKYIK